VLVAGVDVVFLDSSVLRVLGSADKYPIELPVFKIPAPRCSRVEDGAAVLSSPPDDPET
jgi:hypothetical protein